MRSNSNRNGTGAIPAISHFYSSCVRSLTKCEIFTTRCEIFSTIYSLLCNFRDITENEFKKVAKILISIPISEVPCRPDSLS